MDQKHVLLGILLLVVIVIIFISVQKAPYKNGFLTGEDVCAEFQNISSFLNNQSCYYHLEDYPKVLGNYSKNGLTLIKICFCSDYCLPQFWRVLIIYDKIESKEKCAEVGGVDLIDPAWGGYIGCAPFEYDKCNVKK